MSFLESKRAPWVLVAALMLVAYARVAGCGFIWDDDDYVTNNPVLRTIGGLYDIWFVPTSLPQYYPLVHTTFWLEHAVWGLDPMGYHVVNVALHGASALALLARSFLFSYGCPWSARRGKMGGDCAVFFLGTM